MLLMFNLAYIYFLNSYICLLAIYFLALIISFCMSYFRLHGVKVKNNKFVNSLAAVTNHPGISLNLNP